MLNLAAIELIGRINKFIVNPIIGLLFALALVIFLWGVFQFFLQPDSDVSKEEGRNHMLWGLFGVFIMFSVFAIMKIIVNTIGADVPGVQNLP